MKWDNTKDKSTGEFRSDDHQNTRSQSSDSLWYYYELARTEKAQKDTAAALKHYKNAMRFSALTLNQAAWLLQAQGKLRQARSLAEIGL